MRLIGGDSLVRKLQALREATTGPGWARSGKAGAQQARDEVRDRAPKKSGAYARSIKEKQLARRRAFVSYGIGTDKPQAGALEYGSGVFATGPGASREPIRITPRNGQVLAFAWPNAPSGLVGRGGVFFFRHVLHPGIRPQPHFRPAIDEGKGRIVAAVVESQREEIRKALQ